MSASLFRVVTRSTFVILALTVLTFSGQSYAKGKFAPVQSSIVIDADSGEILHASNAEATTYPASLTKMMTLYMVFDQLAAGKLKLTDRFTVSSFAAAQSPSKLGLAPGQSISVEDAIYALVTKSANDIAATVAEGIGGSEAGFATLMTRRAHQLGMARTTFKNASGLPNAGQVTTAADMATLGRALLRNHAAYYHYFGTRSFDFRGQTISTHNRLMLRYEGADGIKTGYINASGFNLVSSAKRGGRRLVGVVLGGRTAAARDRRMGELLDAAFAGTAAEERIEMAKAPAAAEKTTARARVKLASVAKAATVEPATAEEDERVTGTGDADQANWAVQIGAFKLKVSAQNAADAAAKRYAQLADGRPTVVEAKNGGNRVWRARVTGLTEDQARATCKKMSDNKSCLVIQPGV